MTLPERSLRSLPRPLIEGKALDSRANACLPACVHKQATSPQHGPKQILEHRGPPTLSCSFEPILFVCLLLWCRTNFDFNVVFSVKSPKLYFVTAEKTVPTPSVMSHGKIVRTVSECARNEFEYRSYRSRVIFWSNVGRVPVLSARLDHDEPAPTPAPPAPTQPFHTTQRRSSAHCFRRTAFGKAVATLCSSIYHRFIGWWWQ